MCRELIPNYLFSKVSLEEANGYMKELGADWALMVELDRGAESTRDNETGLGIPVCQDLYTKVGGVA
jgi:hypothetical protein